jgi:hypothetical protein
MDAQTSLPLDLPEGVPGRAESDLPTRASKIAENVVGFFALLAEWLRVTCRLGRTRRAPWPASQISEARNER